MSWEPVVPVKHCSGHGVRACIRKAKAGEPRKVVIAIGDDVLRRMGWKPGIKLTILRGRNGDLGQVRISESPGTGYKLHVVHRHKNKKTQHGVVLPLWPGLPDQSHYMEACDWRRMPEDAVLQVELPEWAQSFCKPSQEAAE